MKQAYNRAIERTKPSPVVVGTIRRMGFRGLAATPSQEFGLEPFAFMAGGSFCLEPWSTIVNIAMLTTQSPLLDDVIDLQTLEAYLWEAANILPRSWFSLVDH